MKSGQYTNEVRRYRDEIEKYPILPREEENELARRIKEGDSGAKEKLINSNLRIAVHIARRYFGDGDEMDIINAGNVGLMQAADKWDPDRKKFSTYAGFWIKKEIFAYLGFNSHTIRLSRANVTLLNRVRKARQYLTDLNEREPSSEELVKYILKTKSASKYDPSEIERMVDYSEIQSLDEEVAEGMSMEEVVQGSDGRDIWKLLTNELLRGVLDDALGKLDPKHRACFEMHFCSGMTYEEIALDEGVTRQAVCHNIKKSRERLEKILKIDPRFKELGVI